MQKSKKSKVRTFNLLTLRIEDVIDEMGEIILAIPTTPKNNLVEITKLLEVIESSTKRIRSIQKNVNY